MLYREELRLLTEQLRFSNRLSDRKKAGRTGEVPANTEAKPTTPQVTITVTELEDKVIDIEEVEMDLDDDGWNLAEAA
jgi:hypothetical protein